MKSLAYEFEKSSINNWSYIKLFDLEYVGNVVLLIGDTGNLKTFFDPLNDSATILELCAFKSMEDWYGTRLTGN